MGDKKRNEAFARRFDDSEFFEGCSAIMTKLNYIVKLVKHTKQFYEVIK